MPWQKGEVPIDMFRTYYHGTNYKIEFIPCGCVLEHYNEEDMDEVGDEMMDYTRNNFQKKDGRLKKNQRCPKCNKPITNLMKSIHRNTSEVPEFEYRYPHFHST